MTNPAGLGWDEGDDDGRAAAAGDEEEGVNDEASSSCVVKSPLISFQIARHEAISPPSFVVAGASAVAFVVAPLGDNARA